MPPLIRPCRAFRFTVEDSVCVDGQRQVVAVIGGPEPASKVLHRRAGFRPAGTLSAGGWTFDAWCKGNLMQLSLGAEEAESAAVA